jgi:hypothetical protein
VRSPVSLRALGTHAYACSPHGSSPRCALCRFRVSRVRYRVLPPQVPELQRAERHAAGYARSVDEHAVTVRAPH